MRGVKREDCIQVGYLFPETVHALPPSIAFLLQPFSAFRSRHFINLTVREMELLMCAPCLKLSKCPMALVTPKGNWPLWSGHYKHAPWPQVSLGSLASLTSDRNEYSCREIIAYRIFAFIDSYSVLPLYNWIILFKAWVFLFFWIINLLSTRFISLFSPNVFTCLYPIQVYGHFTLGWIITELTSLCHCHGWFIIIYDPSHLLLIPGFIDVYNEDKTTIGKHGTRILNVRVIYQISSVLGSLFLCCSDTLLVFLRWYHAQKTLPPLFNCLFIFSKTQIIIQSTHDSPVQWGIEGIIDLHSSGSSRHKYQALEHICHGVEFKQLTYFAYSMFELLCAS